MIKRVEGFLGIVDACIGECLLKFQRVLRKSIAELFAQGKITQYDCSLTLLSVDN